MQKIDGTPVVCGSREHARGSYRRSRTASVSVDKAFYEICPHDVDIEGPKYQQFMFNRVF